MRKYYLFCFLPACLQATEYVVGEIMGQLGNQLFIIAATIGLALDNQAEPLFPGLATQQTENIPLNREKLFSHMELNLTAPPVPLEHRYIEPNFHYAKIPYQSNMSINGYFQSEKYFINHKDKITKLFAAPDHIIDYLTTKYSNIIEHPKTVAVHHRSYFKEDPNQSYHITYDLDYYSKAIALFPKDYLFIVFSNDIEWCKKAFRTINRNFIFIENESHYHDFYLISFCKHQIICNSSFSWWGAYLNSNPDKIVIAPPKWFNPRYIKDTEDLLPTSWYILN